MELRSSLLGHPISSGSQVETSDFQVSNSHEVRSHDSGTDFFSNIIAAYPNPISYAYSGSAAAKYSILL